MFVHLGGRCLIRTDEIIAIFSVKNNVNKNFFKELKNVEGNSYIIEDLTEETAADSIILTKEKIYLSAISATTLQKRVNENLIYNNGGNNGREE